MTPDEYKKASQMGQTMISVPWANEEDEGHLWRVIFRPEYFQFLDRVAYGGVVPIHKMGLIIWNQLQVLTAIIAFPADTRDQLPFTRVDRVLTDKETLEMENAGLCKWVVNHDFDLSPARFLIGGAKTSWDKLGSILGEEDEDPHVPVPHSDRL